MELYNTFILFLLFLISTIFAGNVLILPSSLFPVHRYTMTHLASELLKRNHNITWVEYGLTIPKVRLPVGIHEIFWKVDLSDDTINDLYLYRNHSVYRNIWNPEFYDDSERISAWLASLELCNQVLTQWKSDFDEIVKQQFDTVIVDDLYNPCGLLLVGLQKSVFIYWSLTSIRTESAWANQSPSPPSYIPVPGTGFSDELNFFQQTYNLASYLRAIYIHQHIILRRVDKIFRKFYEDSIPESFYIERNASINFINTPPIFDFARPFMPRVVFVGALHCHKPNKLDSELAVFINHANDEDGVVLITSGFSNQWKYAPIKTVEIFVNVFKRMNGTRFIWQYNGVPIKNLPDNVHVMEWVPQQDILGNSKTKIHITHGGLNSVIESVWHGVPIIGIPLTRFTYDNIVRLTSRDVGILLKKENLTEDSLIEALKLIRLEKYKKEMLLFQDMVNDVPYTELNHSSFWIEFIERHHEVPHARSGADLLNVLQYFLIDVFAFLLVILLVIILIIVFIIKKTVRLLRYVYEKLRKRRVPTDSSKKTN